MTYIVPFQTKIEKQVLLSTLKKHGYNVYDDRCDGYLYVFNNTKNYSLYGSAPYDCNTTSFQEKTLLEFLRAFYPPELSIEDLENNIWYKCDQGLICKTDFDGYILYDNQGLITLKSTVVKDICPATFDDVQVFFKRNIEGENE